MNLHPEYIVDENQRRKAVILPLAEWERVVADLEQLDNIRAYDEAISSSSEKISFDEAVAEIKARPEM